jgi:hypothetical protein
MQSRTFTLLVTITDEAMAAPITKDDMNNLEDRVQRGLEEGVRGFSGVSSAMVHAFEDDMTLPSAHPAVGDRMHALYRAKIAHRDLREGR